MVGGYDHDGVPIRQEEKIVMPKSFLYTFLDTNSKSVKQARNFVLPGCN